MSLRVLGLDPGTATFGWGMVESGGERPRYLAHGIITTAPSQSLGERLLQIRTELTQIARSERPDRIAIERLFTQGNLQSAVAVAAARGLALMIAAELLIEVVEATPSEMKRAIAGDGRATKSGVIRAVTQLLNIAGTPLADDAADGDGLADDGAGEIGRTECRHRAGGIQAYNLGRHEGAIAHCIVHLDCHGVGTGWIEETGSEQIV